MQEFLVQNYPDAFEIGREAGVEYLIIKPTPQPVQLPTFTGTENGATVRAGFPGIHWTPEKRSKKWW